jgi:hypothetical protein
MIETRSVRGTVGFGFEGKSYLNRKIKKNMRLGSVDLKIKSEQNKPNQCGLGWIG